MSNKYVRNHFQKSSHLSLIALTMSALTLPSCSHGDRELAQEVEAQPATTRSELRETAKDKIENMPNIGEAQRAKLLAIKNESESKSNELQIESIKVRSLIVSEMTSPNYDPKKVDKLKSRLRDIEKDRLALTFKAIDDSNKALGRDTAVEYRKRYFEELFTEAPHGGTNVD